MNNKRNFKSTRSAIKVSTSIIVTILILLLVFLINFNYKVIGYDNYGSPDTVSSQNFTYKILRSSKNVLCSNHNAHLSNYYWKLTRTSGPNNIYNSAEAYVFAYATKYGRGTGTDKLYGDYVQQAYWRLCNSNTGQANTLYKKAIAYENYRKNYQDLKITNVTRKSNTSVSFTITGSHNDTYGFGKILSVNIRDGVTGSIIKTGSPKYGTQTVNGIGANSIYIEVSYRKLQAESTYSEYKTTRGGYVGQPIVIFEGDFTDNTQTAESSTVILNIDVSMQKYITKINGEELTKSETSLNNRKNKISSSSAVSRAKKDPSPENKNTSGYKAENPVKIDVGDTVTYQIEIYNNTEYNTAVTLEDEFLYYTDGSKKYYTSYLVTGVDFRNISIDKKYLTWANWGTGKTKKCNFTIGGGQTGIITITVTFNGEMNKTTILNSASITSSNNTTIYRTYDTDYVKMNQYKVQLKKYVSKTATNDGQVTEYVESTNGDSNEYPNIRNWIAENYETSVEATFNQLKNICNNISRDMLEDVATLDIDINAVGNIDSSLLNNWNKMDANNDGMISQEDVEIVNNKELLGNYNEETLEQINLYINSDINNDGIVNSEDQLLYQAIKSDLNSDGLLDQNDIYYLISILSDVNGDNKIDINDLYIIKSIFIKTMYEEPEKILEEYIRSDIDNDGIVTSINDVSSEVVEGQTTTTDEGLQKIYDDNIGYIENAEEKLITAQNYLNWYDVNRNNCLDQNDIDSLREKIDGSEENYIEKYNDRLLPRYNDYYGFNVDENKRNEYYNTISNYIFNKIEGNIDSTEEKSLESYYDFNEDGVVDSSDLYDLEEIMFYGGEPLTKKKELYDNGTTIEELLKDIDIYKDDSTTYSLDIVDISLLRIATGEKEYNPIFEQNDNLNSILDINGDGIVNNEDIDIYMQYRNVEINKINTNYIMNNDFINYFESFINTYSSINLEELDKTIYDFNNDGYLTEEDITKLNESIVDISNENPNLSIVEYIGTDKVFIEDMMNLSSILDINKDGIVNEDDYNYLNDLLSYQGVQYNGIYTANDIQAFLTAADINGDGCVKENEITILKSYKNNTINNLDINKDGFINSNDLVLYDEVKNFNGDIDQLSKSIKRNISPEANNNAYSNKTTNYYNNNSINTEKYDNPVEVENGGVVEYSIQVKNNSNETDVYISEITDNLPGGVSFVKGTDDELRLINATSYITADYYNENNSLEYNITNNINVNQNGQRLTFTCDKLIEKGHSVILKFYVRVDESNMSLSCLRNVAEITKLKNHNNKEVSDTTPYDNLDADYIKLRDITIEGIVWNDINNVKDQSEQGYDEKYNKDEEKKLPGIKVYLYRYNKNNNSQIIISSKFTDSDGKYKFTSDDIGNSYNNKGEQEGTYSVVNNEKFIKAPQVSNTITRWIKDSYYKYYVVFEYDGITYTSTPDGMSYTDITDSEDYNSGNYKINSNAREKLNQDDTFNGYIKEGKTRKEFNDRFSTINNQSGIEYTTTNEKEFIPQSNHVYNENMAMQSSTTLIELSNNSDLEEQLKYVNLGLRGRDIFDLELTSDVASTQVTVNNKVGVYQFSNKVNVRGTDLIPGEDMANIESEASNTYVDNYDEADGQQIRNTDLNTSNTGTLEDGEYGENQGLQEIKVTYKITVTNASQTLGTATKVVDYYDKDYGDPKAELYRKDSESNSEVKVKDISISSSNITEGENYNKVELNIGEDIPLSQSQSYYIYLTLTMNIQQLKDTFNKFNGSLNYPTYNMAEIAEYKTYATLAENEYIRGLIDKDSASGSVEKEQVRTTQTEGENTPTTGGNPTTVEYYFSKKINNSVDLSILKYEDDTYATPTLYFVSNDAKRTITGTVFEDYTTIIDNDEDDNLIRTKTGDGKQTGDEPGIEGVTVQLVELTTNKNAGEIDQNEGTVRYQTTTHADGSYEFNGFLPGNYVIRYYYGDTDATFTYDNNPNTKSYNGEDFQSTNNAYDVDGATINKLNQTENLWYAFNENEKVSTGTDNSERRKEVSTNVTGFTDEQMTVLNNVRDGKSMEEANKKDDGTIMTYQDKETGEEVEVKTEHIMKDTLMYATTPNMELTVEKTVAVTEKDTAENREFLDYTVTNMNFGIAEVPVTTIDLQKHVYSLEITDSTGKNPIAEATIDNEHIQVTVNPSKIADNKLNAVINVLSNDLDIDKEDIIRLIDYEANKEKDKNIIITKEANKEQAEKLQYDMTMYSLAREITITKTWDVEGNVLTAPGTSVIDISIENEKLQGAKLEVTYEITANIYAEKNFNNDKVTIPSIKGIVDYIDNDLSYNESLKGTQQKENNNYWTVAKQSEVAELYQESYGTDENRLGTLDPEGTKYTTILTANEIEGGLLLEECGTGTAYITLERVLSAEDTSIGDIITSSINAYEYDNNIEITGLDYDNTVSEDTDDFIFRDRVRTADRYIILAGIQHDTATSETISVHPPTGENNSMQYYIIAVLSLGILVIGIMLIKKYAIKGEDNK